MKPSYKKIAALTLCMIFLGVRGWTEPTEMDAPDVLDEAALDEMTDSSPPKVNPSAAQPAAEPMVMDQSIPKEERPPSSVAQADKPAKKAKKSTKADSKKSKKHEKKAETKSHASKKKGHKESLEKKSKKSKKHDKKEKKAGKSEKGGKSKHPAKKGKHKAENETTETGEASAGA